MEVRRVLRILLVITLCDVCQGACVGVYVRMHVYMCVGVDMQMGVCVHMCM